MAYKVGDAIVCDFYLIDPADGAPESGKVNADWTKQLYFNGSTVATAMTISEVGSTGVYNMTFTPATDGEWSGTASVVVGTSTTYHEFGAATVEDSDMDAVVALIGTTADTSDHSTLFGGIAKARRFGEGKWAIATATMTVYKEDGTTAYKTFTVSPDSTSPTTRTPV